MVPGRRKGNGSNEEIKKKKKENRQKGQWHYITEKLNEKYSIK